jgi:hypothetical protein
MNSPVDRTNSAESQSPSVTRREAYRRYGVQVRNRVIAGLVLAGVGLWVSSLWDHFPHDTLLHKASIWTTGACLGAAEFSLTWARLLYRSGLREKPVTSARLRFEMALALLLCLFFGLYVLDWMKW